MNITSNKHGVTIEKDGAHFLWTYAEANEIREFLVALFMMDPRGKKEPTMSTNDKMEMEMQKAFGQRCLGQLRVDPFMENNLLNDGFRAGWAARGDSMAAFTNPTIGVPWKQNTEAKTKTFSETLNALRGTLATLNETMWRALSDDANKSAREARVAILKAIAELVGGDK